MNEQKFQLGVKALITNNKNEIMLLRVDTSHFKDKNKNLYYWDIPGGRIQEGHTVEDTLLREVEEEIGTREIKVERHFDSFVSNIKIPPHNDGLILFVFRCMLKKPNQKIILNEESTEYKWTPAKEAKKLLTHKYPKSFIDKLDSI
ncbi:MAG: Mutt/Nudix Hydrolase [archaeon GW2011_AR5]|nr:MAG: Mutt/Nudix Hydrolase [archaeon GW2011_AR5]MBS3051713.1 NUDIX hydrolase [Candidatus Aenigmarchaeota archaeon]